MVLYLHVVCVMWLYVVVVAITFTLAYSQTNLANAHVQ